MQRAMLRSFVLALLVGVPAVGTACYSNAATNPPPAGTPFVVRNDGFYDANIYVALSDGRRGRRLGTVSGHSSAVFQIRQIDLHSGDVLMVRVHPIGTQVEWLSPSVTVGPDVVPELRLIADARNALDMSSFYTRLRLASAGPPH